MKIDLRCLLLLFLIATSLFRPAHATAPLSAGRSLAGGLNPDGTLKMGANGSFDARQFRMSTAPDGRPVFRPTGTTGAGDEGWQNGFGLPGNGLDGTVYVVAVDSSGNVYVGGFFRQAGGITANSIAKWNGTAWSSLGLGTANGISGNVEALAIARNGDLYVGGYFIQAGSVRAVGVAKWNGTTWSALGTGLAIYGANKSAGAKALAVASNGDVYVGGTFFSAGGVTATNVARWNGSFWSSVGAGLSYFRTGSMYTGEVNALTIAGNGDVYAGGGFNQSGATAIDGLARWDGTTWSSLGNGFNAPNSTVYAIAQARNGDLYVSSIFTTTGGAQASNVAKWNGTTWSSVGAGLPLIGGSYIAALAVDGNGNIYAGVNIGPGGITSSELWKWDGTSWRSIGTGLNNALLCLAAGRNNKLYAGGLFTATGDGSKDIAHFGVYDPAAVVTSTANSRIAPGAQLFPNPARGAATLRLPAGAPRLPLTLVDALGRTVRRYPAPATAEAALDLRGLPAGTYLVRCGEHAQRLVVE